MDADCAVVLRKAPFLGGQERPARRHFETLVEIETSSRRFLLRLRGIVSALTSVDLFLQNILLELSIPLTTMISLLSARLLPRPRSVTAAAERGRGRSGFSGRSGAPRRERRRRRRRRKQEQPRRRGGGGGGGRGTMATSERTLPPRRKSVTDAGDPPEVSNEPSLLSAPMEVR